MTKGEGRPAWLELSDVDMSDVFRQNLCKVGLHGTYPELPEFSATFRVKLPKGSLEALTLESPRQAAEAQVMKFARALLNGHPRGNCNEQARGVQRQSND